MTTSCYFASDKFTNYISDLFFEDVQTEFALALSDAASSNSSSARRLPSSLVRKLSQSMPGGRFYYQALQDPDTGIIYDTAEEIAKHGVNFWGKVWEASPVDLGQTRAFLTQNKVKFPDATPPPPSNM